MPEMYRGTEASRQPPAYDAHVTSADTDALLAESHAAWDRATAVTWGPDRYQTTFRALWRPDALFVRFDVRDDAPWYTMHHRNACLWEEEVVEIFLDPTCSGTDYAELEINPGNTVCDLHIATLTPVRDVRLDWNFTNLTTVVHSGRGGHDWTALARLPFDDFATLSPRVERRLPVQAGDAWHFNVFRIKRPHGPAAPERDAVYAAWSVPDGGTFHEPEAFRPLRFIGH